MNKNSGILNLELSHLDQLQNNDMDCRKDDLFIYNTSCLRNVQIMIQSKLSYIFRIKSQHILVSMALVLVYLCYFISSPPLSTSLIGYQGDWIFQDLDNQNWTLRARENQIAIFQKPIDEGSDLFVFQKIEKEEAFGQRDHKKFTISCIQKKTTKIACWQSEARDLLKPLNVLSVLKSSSNPMFWKSRKVENLGDLMKIDYYHGEINTISLMKDKKNDVLIDAKVSNHPSKMMKISPTTLGETEISEEDMENIEQSLNEGKLSPLLGLAGEENDVLLPEIYQIKLECHKFIFWTYCEPSLKS